MQSEEELGEQVVAFLKSFGWEVYQEVKPKYGSRTADIVAVRGGQLYVVELKLRPSLDLLEQAYMWRGYAEFIGVGVPANGGRRPVFVEACRGLKFGLILAGQAVRQEVAPQNDTSNPCHLKSYLADSLCEKQKDFAKAGNCLGKRWTTFKGTCQGVREHVEANPGCTMGEILACVETHYKTKASAHGTLARLIDEGVVPGVRSSLHELERVVKYYPVRKV